MVKHSFAFLSLLLAVLSIFGVMGQLTVYTVGLSIICGVLYVITDYTGD